MKPFMLKRDLLKQLIPVAVVATVAAVLLVSPALAAKRQSAWVTVNSTSGAAGTNLVAGNNLMFSGCGYAASSDVSVVVNSPYAMSFTGASTDSSGCFSTSNWATRLSWLGRTPSRSTSRAITAVRLPRRRSASAS